MRDWSNRLRVGRANLDPGRRRNRRRGPSAGSAVPVSEERLSAERPSLAAEFAAPLRDTIRAGCPGLALRPAEERDIPALRALVVADTEAALGEMVPPGVRSLMASLQLDDRRPVIGLVRPETLDAVILEGGAVIGRLVLRRTDRGVRLVDITLLPDRRGRGLGGGLLAALTAAADDFGWTVAAKVWFDSPAKALFRRAGFAKAGETAVDDLLEWRRSVPSAE